MQNAFHPLLLAAATLLVLLLHIPVAKADIITFTYTANVQYSQDQLGIFGPAGGNLTGDAVSLVFTYDTTKGFPDPSAAYPDDTAYGLGDNSPLSARVTTNGFSDSVAGSAGSFIGYDIQGGQIVNFELETVDYGNGPSAQTRATYGYLGNSPLDGEFTISTELGTTYLELPAGLTPVVTDLSAVAPEPSSLLLLSTGLLGVAGVVRKRIA